MNQLFNNFNRIEESQFEVKRNLSNDEEALVGNSKHSLRNCIYLLPFIFLLLSLLIGITLLVHNSKFQNDSVGEAQSSVQYLNDNLKKAPFEDITPVETSDAACPTGYTQEALGNWRGVKEGCLCKDGSVHSKAHCQLASSTECKHVSAHSAKEYKIFKNHKFCGKRYGAWKAISNSESCETLGMKKCQDNICVRGTECPISSITVGSGAPSGANEKKYGASNKLVFGRETTKQPLVDVHVEESGFPCLAQNKAQPLPSSGKGYPLAAVPQTGCGEFGDTGSFSTEFDKTDSENLYKENGLTSVGDLAYYRNYVPKTEKAAIYSVARVQVKNTKECTNVDSKGLQNLNSHNEKVHNEVNILAILVIVFSAIGLLLTFAFLAFRTQIKLLAKKCTFFLILACCLIVVVLACVLFGLYIHNHNNSETNSSRKHFENLEKHNCMKENSFQRAVGKLNKFASANWKTLSWLIIFLFALACAFVVLLLISFIVRKRKRLSPIPDPRF